MNTDSKRVRPKRVRRRAWLFLVALAFVGGLVVWQVAPSSAAVVASSGALRSSAEIPGLLPDSLADLIEHVQPAVVNISTSVPVPSMSEETPSIPGTPFDEFFHRFFGQAPMLPEAPLPRRAMGSGFLMDEQGHVVTNHHVIDGASEITVTLNDGTQHEATLLGADPKTDLALLQIDADEPLPHVNLGDSDSIRAGDWVVAIGNPFGFGGTATTGIVSARGRDLRSGPFDDFLQIDAPINQGNSGGPLFDLAGEVIGINTAIYSPNGGNVGIGFAIPSSQARPILAQLEQDGHIERGWLGVLVQGVDEEIAEGLGLEDRTGALVASVEPGSPAQNAGLQPGDLILRFNGEKVDQAKTLARLVADSRPERKGDLEVWRHGKELHLRATLGVNPEEPVVLAAAAKKEDQPTGRLGISLATLSPELRRRFRVPDGVDGAAIVDVVPGSPAAHKGLRRGDVVLMVGQTAVSNPGDAQREIEREVSRGRDTIVLEVARRGDMQFVPVHLA